MSKKLHLVGQRFRRLLVIGECPAWKNGNIRWLCRCDCGVEKSISGTALQSGQTLSCGCWKRELRSKRSRKALIGKRFGRLLVIKCAGLGRIGHLVWLVRCDCGKEKIITGNALRIGTTNSCGCLQRELVSVRQSGKNHWNYNSALSDDDRFSRRKINVYAKWTKKIFERDGFTCKICGKTGGTLDAHHLNGWHWCKEQRLSLSNGITLCQKCHHKFHKVFGNKNNTEEQFNRFVGLRM